MLNRGRGRLAPRRPPAPPGTIRQRLRSFACRLQGTPTFGPVASTLALLAVVVAVHEVLRFDANRTPASREFVATVEFETWAIGLSATVALWVAVAVLLLRSIFDVFDRTDPGRLSGGLRGRPLSNAGAERSRGNLGLALGLAAAGYLLIVVMVLAALFQTEGGPTNPLYGSRIKVRIIVATVLLLGSPAAVGLWLIQARVGRLGRDLPLAHPVAATPEPVERPDLLEGPTATGVVGGQPRAEWVGELLGLRRLSERILTAVSIGISAGVLSTGALRNALIRVEAATAQTFPSHWVLLYGALFTVVFTLVFVPTLVELRGVAARLVDDAFPIPADGVSSDAWHEGRERMRRMLHLDVSPLRALGPLVGVLGPVLTSLAAVLVPEIAG